jgi:hypothetical protein
MKLVRTRTAVKNQLDALAMTHVHLQHVMLRKSDQLVHRAHDDLRIASHAEGALEHFDLTAPDRGKINCEPSAQVNVRLTVPDGPGTTLGDTTTNVAGWQGSFASHFS